MLEKAIQTCAARRGRHKKKGSINTAQKRTRRLTKEEPKEADAESEDNIQKKHGLLSFYVFEGTEDTVTSTPTATLQTAADGNNQGCGVVVGLVRLRLRLRLRAPD